MRLSGKVALVTGAGSGIGRGIALRFAEDGATIAVCDIDPERADETVAQVGAQGGAASAFMGDVSQRADVQRIVGGVLETLGGLDVLVNNAGILTWGSILDLPEEDWDRVLAVNLK